MAANDDMLDPAIEAMMMRAPFARLAPPEQARALGALGSAEEYDRMRAALLASRSALASAPPALVPRPATLDSLHAAMAAKARRAAPSGRFTLAGLFSRPVPLYQPAVAFALLLLVMVIANPWRPDPPRERIVYVTQPAAPAAAQTAASVAAQTAAPVVKIDTEAIVQRVVDSIKAELARSMAQSGGGLMMASNAGNAPRSRRGRVGRGEAAAIDTVMQIARSTVNARITTPEGNQFVGLGNLPGLDRQRRGKSLAEDSVAGRFHAKMVSERL